MPKVVIPGPLLPSDPFVVQNGLQAHRVWMGVKAWVWDPVGQGNPRVAQEQLLVVTSAGLLVLSRSGVEALRWHAISGLEAKRRGFQGLLKVVVVQDGVPTVRTWSTKREIAVALADLLNRERTEAMAVPAQPNGSDGAPASWPPQPSFTYKPPKRRRWPYVVAGVVVVFGVIDALAPNESTVTPIASKAEGCQRFVDEMTAIAQNFEDDSVAMRRLADLRDASRDVDPLLASDLQNIIDSDGSAGVTAETQVILRRCIAGGYVTQAHLVPLMEAVNEAIR